MPGGEEAARLAVAAKDAVEVLARHPKNGGCGALTDPP